VSKLAFIGLGVMGFPMAGHLATRGGHDVTVYNRSRAKAEAWVSKHKGRSADTPAKAAEGAEIVFCCVGDDPDLREVTLGSNGAFQKMSKGTIFVDHTTASAKLARELGAEAKKRGFEFLDAPVSGGQAGAENGQLTVMVGGDPAAFERAKPAIAAVALFEFLFCFNDFFGPLLYTSENPAHWTLSLGLSQFRTIYQVQWNLTMAATLLFMAPVIIVFFLAQKAFVEGVTLTGVKG